MTLANPAQRFKLETWVSGHANGFYKVNKHKVKVRNAKISASKQETKDRRKQQTCLVRTLKIQHRRLNLEQLEALRRVFIEAKWLYNEIVAFLNDGNSLSAFKLKKTVIHFDKDRNRVESAFQYLGVRVQQSILELIKNSIKSLSALKGNGYKTGRLKFKSEINSLDLAQVGVTYKIENDKIKIVKIPGRLKVNGVEQLNNLELANAKLLNKPDGFYIAVTCFRNKEDDPKPKKKEVGIDMGCATSVTLSSGQKFTAKIRETERLKALSRKMTRQMSKASKGCGSKIKKSKRCLDVMRQIRVEYQKMSNRRDDAANKVVHVISQYRDIYMQDEPLRAWHRGHFSRTVQHSILGRVKAKLVPKAKIVLSSSAPTTQYCWRCHCRTHMTLRDREYKCSHCGLKEDRDIHAAKNMIVLGKLVLNRQ